MGELFLKKFPQQDTAELPNQVLVPGPTCCYTLGYTLKVEYPRLVLNKEASIVSEHTFDISGYLGKLKGDGGLDGDTATSL